MNKVFTYRKKLVMVGVFLIFAFCIVAGEITVYYAGNNKTIALQQHKPRPVVMNVREKDRKAEAMLADWFSHTRKAVQYCDKHNIWGEQRKQITHPQFNAGKAAFDKVRQSNFTIAYKPNYPPLPSD